MGAPGDRAVTITDDGRSGRVIYRELGRELSFYWDLGGGDVVASVHVGTETEWRTRHPWALERRAEILRFVADEVVRQKTPTSTPEIDERSGWINLRAPASTTPTSPSPSATPTRRPPTPAPPDVSWIARYRRLQMRVALVVLVGALILAGLAWVKNTLMVIDPGPGTPVGWSVRTDAHVATLLQTLEPYTPSLARDHSKDTYAISLFLVPLDGSEPKHVPVAGGLPGSAFGLAKILGSDGRTLWVDVNGVGGVDLRTFRLVSGGSPSSELQGARALPFAPRIEASLAVGYFTGADAWLGLLSPSEAARGFEPGRTLRRVTHAENAKQMRGFYRGTVGVEAGSDSRRIITMEPMGGGEYLNAAFLRMDDGAEPLRVSDPDGALMIYTSQPGLAGTLMVARVDASGAIIWRVDTAIDRFKLQQILPGDQSVAFVGTRLPVPGKVSEPLLVIVDNATGEIVTHSLWR